MATMTTIRVDSDVYAELEKRIESFADTPNAILRRLLGLEGGQASPRIAEARALYQPWLTGFRRGRPAQSQPQQSAQAKFSRPILEALAALGGEARAKDVLDDVGRKLASEFLPGDDEPLSNGEPRWRVTAAFERQNLIDRGFLDRAAPRGRWRITEAGRNWLAMGDTSGGPAAWDLGLGLKVAARVIRENKQWLQEMASR